MTWKCGEITIDGELWSTPLPADTPFAPPRFDGLKVEERGTLSIDVLDRKASASRYVLTKRRATVATLLVWADPAAGRLGCVTPGDADRECPPLLDAVARAAPRTALRTAALDGTILTPDGCGVSADHAVACPDGSWLDWAVVTEMGKGLEALALDRCAAPTRIGATGSIAQHPVACTVLGEAASCLWLEGAAGASLVGLHDAKVGPTCLSCGGGVDPTEGDACSVAFGRAP